jgi:hypothetical protein
VKPLDPFRSEDAMFRVLLAVVVIAAAVVLIALAIRAVA